MKKPVFEKIPASEYHADAAKGLYLSSHNLAQFRACPYTYHLLMTGKMKRLESPALALGRAVHCFTLEGDEAWKKDFLVTDGPINERTGQPFGRNTQKFQDFLAQQKKEIVSCKEFEQIERMANSVWSHPDAHELLSYGEAEGTVRLDDYCGVPVQIRLDWFSPDYGIVDLKTTSEDLSRFESESHKYGYPYQFAFYRAVLEKATGMKYPVYAIVVEKTEPYRAAVFKYSEEVLDQAQAENEKAIKELLECREKDEWFTRFRETRLITRI